MTRLILSIAVVFAVFVAMVSCEKVLDIDLPDAVNGIVFEGYIENGTFPYVLVSRSSNYFSPINTAAQAIVDALVEADSVFIEFNGNRVELPKICLSELNDTLRAEALALLGFDELPPGLNLCLNANPLIEGQFGTTYRMIAYVEGKEYNAVTTIGQPVELDSLWYKDELPLDSNGFVRESAGY